MREKFVGTVLWDVFDFLTFGVFEKKKDKSDQAKADKEKKDRDPSHQANETSQ